MKSIKLQKEARQSIKKGMDIVADAVKVTIGPFGRNAALFDGITQPVITNDGVSIARSIILEDKFEDIGAAVIKEVAETTNEQAGDGTTTSIVLTQALVNLGMKNIKKENVIDFKKGMEAAASEVVYILKQNARTVKSFDDIYNIANISAESKEMGRVIARTVEQIGADGVVSVEDSQVEGLSYKIIDGFSFGSGYASPYMVTNPEKMEALYQDVHCLVYNGQLADVSALVPIVEALMKESKNKLVIFSLGADGEALASLILNKNKKTFHSVVVKAPGYMDSEERLIDIATYVGATVLDDDLGIKLKDAKIEDLGFAKKVIVTKNKTTIISSVGPAVDERISELKSATEETSDKSQKSRLEERIATLAGKVAVINVGASTETQMNYLKLKIEDAVNATQAAVEEGVVAGAGLALKEAANEIGLWPWFRALNSYERGWNTVIEACSAPYNQICRNAGRAIEITDDVIDPVKVTRCAINNSVSAAATFLTTDVAVVPKN